MNFDLSFLNEGVEDGKRAQRQTAGWPRLANVQHHTEGLRTRLIQADRPNGVLLIAGLVNFLNAWLVLRRRFDFQRIGRERRQPQPPFRGLTAQHLEVEFYLCEDVRLRDADGNMAVGLP